MKIAYVTARFPHRNAEHFVEPEIRRLYELGHEVLIVPTRPGDRGALHAATRYDVCHLPLWGAKTFAAAFAEAVERPRAFAQALSAITRRPCSLKNKVKNLAVFPKALAVARRLRNEGFEHIHAHWLSAPSTVAYVASQLSGIPWSCTAHRFDIFEDNLIAEKARSAAFVRVVSKRGRDALLQKIGEADSNRICVGHLGVVIPRGASRAEHNGGVRILCPANLVPVKGHDYLISALAKLKSDGVLFECDFAGDGPLRSQIEREIQRAHLRNCVHLRGVIDHDRLCAQLALGRYDIVVLASTESGTLCEGIPVALVEAMAAAVPCVATQTGSIPELIENGICSLLVPQRDPHALARAIAELAHKPRLRAALGRYARERVIQDFDVRRTTEQLLSRMQRV